MKTTKKTKYQKPKFIVGIGASAGGLEALRLFFQSLTDANQMSFVIVQHLAPLYQSRLVELISHTTKLPVSEAKNNEPLHANHIYVTPPNKDILVEDGFILLKEPSMKVGPKPSIDRFFKSMAISLKRKAIAVILSGTGTDGSIGFRAVKNAGGVTFVQKPESAKYDGMPKAAKLTDAFDFELTPEEIAKKLSHFSETTQMSKPKLKSSHLDPYLNILELLNDEVGANFAQYKMSTIHRRIDRRVAATESGSVQKYLDLLTEKPAEINILFQDILISVTSFFRDPGAFSALEKQLMRRLREKPDGSNFRCWVVGCATGEEAYTLVIILREIAEKLKRAINIQVFATDIDERALQVARKGVYSKNSFNSLPQGLKSKYFSPIDERLQTKSVIRDSVIFARHNINQDPPFLNLDLATCRNVLIYFTSQLQSSVFKTLHYSLSSGGLLFLGKSENVPDDLGLFKIVDKNAKIYTRIEVRSSLPRLAESSGRRQRQKIEGTDAASPEGDLYLAMIRGFAPDSVIVGEDNQVRHYNGEVGKYLNLGSGAASHNIVKFVNRDMSYELASLLSQAKSTTKLLHGRNHLVSIHGQQCEVFMSVLRLATAEEATYLVKFESRPALPIPKKKHARSKVESYQELYFQSQKELKAIQEHLQSLTEEQETATEEMQSLNEELQSSNEELQSSNEELETANEEMQSTNEELTTLNQELNVKSAELIALNQTMQAVQSAIIYPLVILDKHMKILSFNPAARYLLRINDSDIGNSIRATPTHFEISKIIEKVETALTTGTETNLIVKEKGRAFDVQVQIFRGSRETIQGVVISFVDNTEITTALDETNLIRERLTNILSYMPAVVTMKDPLGIYIYGNPEFAKLMGKSPDDLLGMTDEDLFGEDLSAQIRARDFEVTNKKVAIQTEEKMELDGKSFWWASARFPLLDSKRRVQSVCTISLDITDRVLHQHQLELFKEAMSSALAGIILLHGHGGDYRATLISDEVTENLGVRAEALKGQSLRKLLSKLFPHNKSAMNDHLVEQIKTQKNFMISLALDPSHSEQRWIELRSSRLNFNQDTDSQIIITIFDVTKREHDQKTITQQQDELNKFSRYSALGEIAAGIAHEINTPLNVITTKTDFLRKLSERGKLDGDRVTALAIDVDQMAKTIANIVTGLKSLATSNLDQFKMVSLQQLITDTLRVCEFRIHRFGIDLRVNLPEGDISAECYPIQITQIIINLINNSIDAIVERQDKWIELSLEDLGDKVSISVMDSGDGISSELAEKIMTPFFTTKTNQKGTGIGLSLSRTIARKHKGDLILDQNSAKTRFLLEFPKVQN